MLECLHGLIDFHLGCLFVFGGDINLVKNSSMIACSRMDYFGQRNKLHSVDLDICDIEYHYHCETGGHYSTTDYFICSPLLLQNVQPKSVIVVDEDNTSNHYAISLCTLWVTIATNSQLGNKLCHKLCWDRAELSP